VSHKDATVPSRPDAPQPWAKSRLASLADSLPGWEPWYVETPFDPASRYTWCARPEGAATSTCKASDPAELIAAVAEYETDLPAHIQAARDELQRTPIEPATAGRRNVLSRQLAAIASLHDRRQAEARHPAGEQQAPTSSR
jgi:hypothetical protein